MKYYFDPLHAVFDGGKRIDCDTPFALAIGRLRNGDVPVLKLPLIGDKEDGGN